MLLYEAYPNAMCEQTLAAKLKRENAQGRRWLRAHLKALEERGYVEPLPRELDRAWAITRAGYEWLVKHRMRIPYEGISLKSFVGWYLGEQRRQGLLA